MALVNVPIGSLIIPMDTIYQNRGMWTAYGLVYRLLTYHIPVQWAIAPGKSWGGTDFTASATDLQTGTPITAHTYKGGSFIVDASHDPFATALVADWQQLYPNTKVHRAAAAFQAWVDVVLHVPARIAVESSNAAIALNYLNAAGIPDSTGSAWTASSPDILDEADQAVGSLFEESTATCRRRAYDILLSPHAGVTSWLNPTARANLDEFVRLGGNLHAMSYSITGLENPLKFLTTTGLAPSNLGDTGTFTVYHPDYPLDQAVPTTPAQARPAGTVQTWQRNLWTYYPATRTMANFLAGGLQHDFMISGPYKGGTGAGMVTYEGGGQYSVSLPYLSNMQGPYLRFFYNSVLLAAWFPEPLVQVYPDAASPGIATTFEIAVGSEEAANLSIAVTLDPMLVNPATVTWTLPPTGGAFPTYTWSGLAPGTLFHGTFDATLPVPVPTILVTYSATYSDAVLNPHTMDQCVSVRALMGPIPAVSTADYVTAFPNLNVDWRINAFNEADVTAPDTGVLTNVVLTDTLPAGLTFVSATLPPTSITPGPGGTTILSWDLPDIPPGGGGEITQVTALTPPHTTAILTHTMTLSGTAPGGAPASDTDTGWVAVINQAPTVSITQPPPPAMLAGTVNVCWNGADPDGDPLFYDAYYSPDGGTTWVQFAFGVSGVNPVCAPWNTTGLNGTDFLIRVVATDTDLTGQSEAGPFVVDNSKPTVKLIAPPGGSTLCGQVTLEASASDAGSGVAQVEFQYSLDGGATWTGIAVVIAGPPWTVDFETTLLPDGPIQVRAVATDLAGNEAISTVGGYVIDNTPPTVAIIAPADGSTVSGTVTVQGTVSEALALERVEWRIDGVLLAIQTVAPFDFVWDTTQFVEGPHTFAFRALDSCLNFAEATATFLVDNVPDHTTQVGVDGQIIIPPQKPDAEKLLKPIVQIEVTKTVVFKTPIGGKVLVVGVIHLLIPYVADLPDQSVHAVELDLPFQTYLLWPELPPDTPVKVTAILLEAADFRLVDPRTISKFIVFLVGVELA